MESDKAIFDMRSGTNTIIVTFFPLFTNAVSEDVDGYPFLSSNVRP